MISLKDRTVIAIEDEIRTRKTKFAMVADNAEITQAISRAIRILNDIVHNPRNLILLEAGPEIDLTTAKVDEILKVTFSDNKFPNSILPEVGLLPLLTNSSGFTNLESIADYLIVKGTLNILMRQMRSSPDYEYYPPILRLNGKFRIVSIEYLPYLDPTEESWEMFENEYRFILDYAWADLNIINSEAMASASLLGVGKEAIELAKYWEGKKTELQKKFEDSGVIDYVG